MLDTNENQNVYIREIERIISSLSPENLTCDGEASQLWVRIRRAQLMRELRVAVRGVDQSLLPSWLKGEIDSYLATQSTPSNPDCQKFSKGDRVEIRHRGQVIRGTIIRSNRKTCSVQPDGAATGRYYRASPNILHHI
jgi:hypothetical protein